MNEYAYLESLGYSLDDDDIVWSNQHTVTWSEWNFDNYSVSRSKKMNYDNPLRINNPEEEGEKGEEDKECPKCPECDVMGPLKEVTNKYALERLEKDNKFICYACYYGVNLFMCDEGNHICDFENDGYNRKQCFSCFGRRFCNDHFKEGDHFTEHEEDEYYQYICPSCVRKDEETKPYSSSSYDNDVITKEKKTNKQYQRRVKKIKLVNNKKKI